MAATASLVMSSGEGLPGMAAVLMAMSTSERTFLSSSARALERARARAAELAEELEKCLLDHPAQENPSLLEYTGQERA